MGAGLSEVDTRVRDAHEAGHVVLGRAKEAGCVGIGRAAAGVGRYGRCAEGGDCGGDGGGWIGRCGGGRVARVRNDDDDHSGDGEDEGDENEDKGGVKEPHARGVLVAVALALGAGVGWGNGRCLGEGFLRVVEVLVGFHGGWVVGEHPDCGNARVLIL